MRNAENIAWSPEDYAKTAVVADEVGQELLARLDWLTIQPKVILDIGCGIGTHANALAKRYPEAKIIAIDVAETMLAHAAVDSDNIHLLCNLSEKLPLRNQSIDLVFANFLLPWQAQLANHFKEWRRVLRANGVLVFSALGPDTLSECYDVIPTSEMPNVIDMHDMGDELVQVGFSEPVLDASHYTLTYREPAQLLSELIASGMWMPGELPDLATLPMEKLALVEGKWAVTYEVILAHAFAPAQKSKSLVEGEVRIPVSEIKRI